MMNGVMQERLPADRRRQAQHAINWATTCQDVVNQHTETLLSALR